MQQQNGAATSIHWGSHYQLLDVAWATSNTSDKAVAPLICRIDKLLKLEGKLLRLAFDLPRDEGAFAEVALFRPTHSMGLHSTAYHPESITPRLDTRTYPGSMARGALMQAISCSQNRSCRQVRRERERLGVLQAARMESASQARRSAVDIGCPNGTGLE